MTHATKWTMAVVLGMALAATAARAEDGQGEGNGRPCHKPHPKLREKILEKFDADGDGQLNEAEREAAKAAMQERRGERHERLMEKFDANGDGQLDDAEKAAAKEALKEFREKHCGCNGESGDRPHGNNGVGNGEDPPPHGNPKVNDGAGSGPGNPGAKKSRGRSF